MVIIQEESVVKIGDGEKPFYSCHIVNMVVKKLYLEYICFLRQTYYLVVKRVKIGMLF